MLLALIALGGAAGALARYGLSGLVHSLLETTFPAGTLVVNVLGSAGLGLGMRLLEGLAVSTEVRSMIVVGFLGAFTTFSTFSYETVMLLEGGEWGRAAGYAAGSFVLGVAGVLAGFALASLLLQTRG